MTIRMVGTEAHLEGDWTLTGAVLNIDSLTHSLQQIEFGKEMNLRIDCRQICKADASGLQLLHVWMECARMRGVEPALVNVPERLRHTMQGLIGQCFIITCPDAAMMAGQLSDVSPVIPFPYQGPIFVGSSSAAQRTAMYASQPQSSPP